MGRIFLFSLFVSVATYLFHAPAYGASIPEVNDEK